MGLLFWVWLAGESLADVCRRDKLPYDRWLKEGNIIFEGKSVIDISSVKSKLLELATKFKIGYVGFDPHLADDLKTWTEWEMVPVPQQTNFLSPAYKTNQGKDHARDRFVTVGILFSVRWSRLRGLITDANGNIRLNKAKSTSRIDALAALVNAEFIAARHPEPQVSAYSDLTVAEIKNRMIF